MDLLSPEAFFEEGACSGKYTLGEEEAYANEKGDSVISDISDIDYAVAMVDEFANASHLQKHFSVIL